MRYYVFLKSSFKHTREECRVQEGLCVLLWMCVLCVSFGSKVRPRTFGFVMGSALLCIIRSKLLVYSAGSGVNRVQVVCLDLVRYCFILY